MKHGRMLVWLGVALLLALLPVACTPVSLGEVETTGAVAESLTAVPVEEPTEIPTEAPTEASTKAPTEAPHRRADRGAHRTRD